MNKNNRKGRLIALLMAIGLLMIACILFAAIRTLSKRQTYIRKAMSQSTGQQQTIVAAPGNIVDKNGVYLATSVKVYRLILDPKVLYETEDSYEGSVAKTVELVSTAFGIDAAELQQTFTQNAELNYVRYTACGLLSEETVDQYRESVTAFNKEKAAYNEEHDTGKIKARVAGIWFEEEYRRSYPQKDLLSKVIGYTTRDATGGLTGLELQYNEELRGTNGKIITYISDDGSVTKEVQEAEDGYTLVTSLDANVSRIVQEEIQAFQEEYRAKRVNVLVYDPNSGEIISMESDTEFDLNHPSDLGGIVSESDLSNPADSFLLQEAFRAAPEKLAEMTPEELTQALVQQVQQNWQVSGTFEPGSTAKTITLAAAIEENVITQDSQFLCEGSIPVDRYTIHCHSVEPCGWLTPIEAIGRSCNVCFVQIANQLGSEKLVEYQKLFGLGQKTGVDLPGEANTSGLIYHEDTMGEIERATCSFGQGFNVTMLQMAAAYSSVVNGGNYYEPHVVTEIRDNAGNTVSRITPTLVRKTISDETAEYLKECLEYVTVYGTATPANTYGYDLGGKTGAAEKLPRGTGKYIVSFMGIAPIQDAELMVYVVVDEPDVEDQSQSLPAQVLAKSVLQDLYSYFGLFTRTADDAYTYDWSAYRDSSGETDSMNGESFIDDPDQSMEWITDPEVPEVNMDPEHVVIPESQPDAG